jgi:hypothetical protein
LGLDAVIKGLSPEWYTVQNVTLTEHMSIYSNISHVIANTPKAILQSWFILATIAKYSPFIDSGLLVQEIPVS